MVNKKCFILKGLVVPSLLMTTLCLNVAPLTAMQSKDPLIYFKWAGSKNNEPRLNIIARLQEANTSKVLEEKTLHPGEAIMYNSASPVNLYLKKDEFYSKLSSSWTGPITLEPNRPQYGRYNDPSFEFLVDCDPSIMSCPVNNKTSLALE